MSIYLVGDCGEDGSLMYAGGMLYVGEGCRGVELRKSFLVLNLRDREGWDESEVGGVPTSGVGSG